jgi:ribonuclease E
MVLETNRDLVHRRLIECLSRDRTKHQVAEVTSLGLVQMTRKKLGLGLLETFSEPCEVCAGRGVIVFHDPVVRRPSQQTPQGDKPSRRSKSRTTTPVVSPHGIPEGAKSALAQIAASTLHHHDEVEGAHPALGDHEFENEISDDHDVTGGDEVIEILDIPVAKVRRGRGAPIERVDAILENVLDALPEPKASGQGRGRGRGRRVSTGPISTSESASEPTSGSATDGSDD